MDLGLIDVYGLTVADPVEWIAKLRSVASKRGCDGIVLGIQPRAVCIVFTTPGPLPSAPAACPDRSSAATPISPPEHSP
jgi:hypothetical protein